MCNLNSKYLIKPLNVKHMNYNFHYKRLVANVSESVNLFFSFSHTCCWKLFSLKKTKTKSRMRKLCVCHSGLWIQLL